MSLAFKNKTLKGMEIFFLCILALYPLRHVNWGLDLWDTGYNYANFLYAGLEHMDAMWFFATYLATVVGHFFTLLPAGQTLIGLNVYTGLFVSALALLSYFFCTRSLQMPKSVAFLGNFTAVSLCWCPTALLYNYLTYLFFLLCVIFLYLGLTASNQKRQGLFLILAGACLGTNLFVRFSNLPQMGLILAVWVYAWLTWREKKDSFLKRLFCHTGLCLAGYLTAVAVFLGYISLRYGFDAYVAGICRLFAMTDTATDYTLKAMIYGLFSTYIQNLYWYLRIVFFFLLAMGAAFGVGFLKDKLTAKKAPGSLLVCLAAAEYVLPCIIGLCLIGWLYLRGFCSLDFTTYNAMLLPNILLLLFCFTLCAIRIFTPGCPKEEKLLAGLLILVLFLTSIGSNNGVYPSINNLFLALPYVLWSFVRFAKAKRALAVAFGCFLGFYLFQSIGFGMGFVFVEAHGATELSATVENNSVLSGAYMSQERADWMREISAYIEEEALAGTEVILYGNIPALSFYLKLPSAFNPWSDLASYDVNVFAQALEEVKEMIRADGAYRPIIIADVACLTASGAEITDEKWALLLSFMEEEGYEIAFCNEKFVLWR